ncbi:MAG: serine hydrolase domain-containing protein [Kofleriaceae bacterium]
MRSLVALVVVFGCEASPPQPAPRRLDPPIRWAAACAEAEARLGRLHERERMPGVQAAVIGRDGVIWQAARGTTEAGAPLTPTMPMRLASVSKVVTAMLLARMVAAGRIELDAQVSTYVPSWPADPPVTVRELAGHLGGIRHYNISDLGRIERHATLADAARDIFAADPREAVAGTRYHYSSWGYTLLGAALEGAAQMPYLALLDRELAWPIRIVGDPDATARWPAGGLLATASDVAQLGRLVLPEAGYLPRALLATMLTSQHTVDGKPTGVGLGWRVGTDAAGRKIAHHAGNMQSARSVVVVYLELGVVVALLSNERNTPSDVELAAGTLAEPFLD